MSADNINWLAVVGTGQMGPGIAAVAALAGTEVTLVARNLASAARGQTHFASDLAFLTDHGLVTQAEADAAAARLTLSTDLATSVAASDMVIESIVEHLPTKQAFFHTLDELCPPEVILASNTSGLRISDIAADMVRPERAVTTHFWNPAHLIPLVEVIQGEQTTEEVVQTAYRFLQRCGKQPVIGRKDVLGQIGNRLQQAVMREAIYMLQEGIASAEDIETALKLGPGLRWPVYGPLEHLDVVGLDMALAIQGAVLPGLCNESEPGRLLVDLVQAGHRGVSTGKGFYDWTQRSVDDLIRLRNGFVVARVKEARGEDGLMRLSYCTWGMMNIPITEVIPAVAAIGYRGIELAVTPKWPTDLDTLDRAARQQIRTLCREHDLCISAVAGHTSVCEDDPDRNADNMDRLRRTIDLADELRQVDEPPIVCSLLGGHVDDWGRVKERVAERVCELGDYAARRGVIFACEPHSGTAFDLPRKALWLLEQVRHPAVRLNFDISHFDILAIPTRESVPLMAPHSAHTHVKDQRGIFPYHEFLTPGSGPFDFVEYLSAMHEAGYTGWVGMEISVMVQRKPGYDPFVDAALGYYALKHAFCMSGAPLEE